MIIEKLKVRNFRNYENSEIAFDKGIHFIVGKNGQGKTNLLEAIYYLSCTKSHRTNINHNLIKEGTTFFMLEADLFKNERKLNLKCIVNETFKNLYFYRTPIKKVSDFIGTLNAIMFCPNDMYLFQTSPKNRRRFVDLELGKISKSYTNTLATYDKLLKERNAYLKKAVIDPSLLLVFDERMIDCQITIIKQRFKFIDDILKNSRDFYQKLSHDQTNIGCKYISFVEYEDENIMRQKMKEKYQKSYERDILYKVSNVGIHKDDFIFTMNEHEVVSYASQGQKRSIILALKLGIVKTIFLLTKTYPVLLLDDVFSELDEERREMLLNLLDDEIQIFISSTDKILIKNKHINYWIVENGTITACKEDK